MKSPARISVTGAIIAALVSAATLPSLSRGEEAPVTPGEDTVSDTEKHVSRAIASAYVGDSKSLEDEYVFFKSLDGFLEEQKQEPTGLSDNILDLTICTIADRDAFIAAQRRLLKETPDKEMKQRVNYRLADDLSNANSLLLTDRYNRFTFLFNTFVRPLSLVAVGYFPALIDAGMATILNLDKFTDLSVEEKKALVLYERFQQKYPESNQAEILRRRITNLNRKRIKTLYGEEIAAAREKMANEEYWPAQQHYKNALAYRPDGTKALKGLERARRLENEKNRLKMKTLEPAEKSREFHETADDQDYRDILYAVASGSPEMIIYESEDYLKRYARSTLVPYALYAIAVAHDMKGVHEKAKELLADIAENYPDTHIGRHSGAYLADPDYNLLRRFAKSRRVSGRQTAQYVLLGPDFAKNNIILGTSRFITQGLQAIGSMGTFNAMAMIIRGVNSLLRNPVSEQDVIDNALKYVRRYPDSPATPDLHLVLSRAYARRKNLAKAAYHYEASGKGSEKAVTKLNEKAATQYLDFADATESKAEKLRCYDTIVTRYPHTSAAATALEKLALLEREREPLFELDRKTIADNPLLFSLSGLHLGPHLLDGDRSNGEVAPRGLYSTRTGKITIVYEGEREEEEKTFDIDPGVYRRLFAFAEELKYRERLGTGARRPKFPVEVRGSIGDDGLFVYPRLKAIPYEKRDQYLYK